MTTAVEAYRYGRLKIAFFDKEIPMVVVGRAVYFPVRAMCKEMDIGAQAQVEKLRADTRIAPYLRELPVPTIKGARDATCVRKQDVSRWLTSIDPARCSIGNKTRDDLEKFQALLFEAADRWLFGDDSVLTYDPATKGAKPITGKISLGNCPSCGAPLALVMCEHGNRLVLDGEDE